MNIQNSIKAAIGALLVGAAFQASATVVPVTATGVPTATTLLTSASPYTGSFDLSFLTGQFNINSLAFSFTFADDKSDVFTPQTLSWSSSTGDFVYSSTTKTFVRTTTVTQSVAFTGEKESVKLSFGNIDFSGATSQGAAQPGSSSTTSPLAPAGKIWAKNNGVKCTSQEVIDHDRSCKEIDSFDVTVTNTSSSTTDYTGNFEIANSLLSYNTLVADLVNNKSLGFSFGVTGDLYLTNAQLTVDYTNITPAPVDVPEPGSLALFGIALMGVAGIRRARRA